MPRRPSDPRDLIGEILGDVPLGSFASMAEAQRQIESRLRDYNARPQADLGGLSPAQMSALLYGDWSTTGAFRLNEKLSADDIGDPDMLHNARAFLTALRDEGPAKLTAGGNLSREFVGRMLPRLRWPAGYIEDVKFVNKVIDELDVPRLETLRYLLLFAKLIHKRKGFFNISPTGRALLDDARRGELLALLFRTFFRSLDLRDVDGWDGDEGLQQTITYTFWRLRKEAKDWTSPAHLVETAWLNDAKDSILPPFAGDGTRFRAARLERRVLEPLVSLGVLESRDLPSANRWERPIEVRTTPLFDRLMRFEL